MRKNTTLIYTILLLLGDFLAILASFVIAYILRVSLDPRPLIEQIPALTYLRLFIAISPFWLVIFAFLGLYRQEIYIKRIKEMILLFVGTFIGVLHIIAYEYVTNETILPARLVLVYAFILAFSLLVLTRNILWQVRKYFFRKGIGVNRTMIIGSSEISKEIADLLHNTPTSGYYIAIIVGGKSIIPEWFKGFHYTNIDKAVADLSHHKIDTIIQTKLYDHDETNRKILDGARNNHVDYKYIPAEGEFYAGKSTIELFHYFPVISVHPTPLLGWGRVVKRIFDIILSLIFIILTSPIMLISAVAIKLTDTSGPIFFKQKRLSRYGQKVSVFKFRTMKQEFSGKDPKSVFEKLGRKDLVQILESGEDAQLENDPRLTNIGGFLRKTSIDELPQLFNVLRGEISLIGPRAIVPEDMNLYKGAGALMLNVKTGITGLAQVTGRSDLSYEERARLNLYYVQNWSFWLDIYILLKTIPAVIFRKNTK